MLGFFVIFWFPGLTMLCVTRPLPLLPSYWMFALWDSLYCELWLTSTTSFSASQLSTALLEPFTRSKLRTDLATVFKVQYSFGFRSEGVQIDFLLFKNHCHCQARIAPPTELPHWHISLLLSRVYCGTPRSPHPANISSQLQLRLPTPELFTEGHTFTVQSRQERCHPFKEK